MAIVITNIFAPNTVIRSAEVNRNFQDTVDWSAFHETETSAVHGVTGDIVGTTDTQTLSNKTLITPTIADFTNANHDHADVVGGGALAESAVTDHQSAIDIDASQVTSGTLPVTVGGTGSTSFTQGLVVFGGSGGTSLAQDTTFFWNDATNRLYLGTNTPTIVGDTFNIENAFPGIGLFDTNSGVDAKGWSINAGLGTFVINTKTDAGGNAGAKLQLGARSGTDVGSFSINLDGAGGTHNVLADKYERKQSDPSAGTGSHQTNLVSEQTTDATLTILFGRSLVDNSMNYFSVKVVSVETGAAGTRSAYQLKGAFFRSGGGGATQEGATEVDFEEESFAALDCDFATVGSDVRVNITGRAGTTLDWFGVVDWYSTADIP